MASRLCREGLITKQTVFRRTEGKQCLQRTVAYTITDAGRQALRESLEFYDFLGNMITSDSEPAPQQDPSIVARWRFKPSNGA